LTPGASKQANSPHTPAPPNNGIAIFLQILNRPINLHRLLLAKCNKLTLLPQATPIKIEAGQACPFRQLLQMQIPLKPTGAIPMQVKNDILGVLCPVNRQGEGDVMHFVVESLLVFPARD